MSGSELLSTLDELHDEIAERETRRREVIARLDEIGYAKEIGAHDTARLIADRYRLDPAEAARLVRFGKALPKYSAVAAALPGGCGEGMLLHPAQAEAIMSALEQIPAAANVPVDDLIEAEQRMVQAAQRMCPSELRSMGVQVRNILDTDGPEPREDAARQKEDLWLKKTEDGVRFGGNLAAENAELFQTLIQAGAKPHKAADGEPDPRSRGKRHADALVDVLNIAAGSGELPGRGAIKPHITVIINLDDLINAGKNATGDLVFGDGLSASAVRRLACDAGVIPVVLGSDSQPLDVGREVRFVTPALRNVLNQRDRGCVVCGAPPIYCDAHHLASWLDGGITSVANLVLLCRVHHTALHKGHWTIQIIDNQVQVTHPTWADRPPGRHRKPTPPSPPVDAPLAPPDAGTCTTAADADADAPPTLNRVWPFSSDANWITPQEAAAFDPWADNA